MNKGRYYPVLRGRLNELLALQELLKNGKLSNNVIPIIEPVRLSATLVNTLELFHEKGHALYIVKNPIVGSYISDQKNTRNRKYYDDLNTFYKNGDDFIRFALYVNDTTPQKVKQYKEEPSINLNNIMAICLSPDLIPSFNEAFVGLHPIAMVPYARAFTQIKGRKVLITDNFKKLRRNSEYKEHEDEFFSSDHLYCDDGYVGFADYSIIGEEYTESGFAPYAVAIHIVYFDENDILRVHHFVSDTNDDISDPAGKFYEALEKLINWNEPHPLNTIAMKQFEKIYKEQSYPGLGIVKRLSIMHHLELMGKYLDR